MMFPSFSQAVRRVLVRKSGSRGRGRAAMEVLETRCLLSGETGSSTENPVPNPEPPASSMPAASGDDSLVGGTGTPTADDSLIATAEDPVVTTPPDDSLVASAEDSLPTGYGDDSLMGDMPGDSVPTGYGDDSLTGGTPGDSVPTGSGDDSLPGGMPDDSVPTGSGDDSLPDGGGGGTDTIWSSWFGDLSTDADVGEGYIYEPDPNEEPFDWEAFDLATGSTVMRDYFARKELFAREAAGEIVNWDSTVPNDTPDNSTDDEAATWFDLGGQVTINVSPADSIVEGAGYASFTIQVSSIGVGNEPITVWVYGYSQDSEGRLSQLSLTPLTFDLWNSEQTVLVPIPEDDGWHPENALGVLTFLEDPDLYLSGDSVNEVLTTIVEDDPYYDPESEVVDYTNFWLTEEAALLRESPDAAWYAQWLPIYPPNPGEVWEGTPEESSEPPPITDTETPTVSSQSSDPIIAAAPVPNAPTSDNSGDSPPPVIAAAPVPDAPTSDDSVPAATAPDPVITDSSTDTTSTTSDAAVDSTSPSDESLTTSETSTAELIGDLASDGSTIVTSTSSSDVTTADNSTTLSSESSTESVTTSEWLADQSITPTESSTTTESTDPMADSLSDATASDELFVESSSSTSVVDQLLFDGDSLEGGSAADPVLGEDTQLYVDADGNVVVA